MFKHRFYRKDLGIISTERIAVYGGVEIDDNLDPFLGLVYTKIDVQQGEMAFPTWAFGVLVGAVVVLVVAVAALGARLCCARRYASDDYDGGRDSTTDEKGAEDTQRV